eukprot:2561900-Amphidinium_carterae.1
MSSAPVFICFFEPSKVKNGGYQCSQSQITQIPGRDWGWEDSTPNPKGTQELYNYVAVFGSVAGNLVG